MSNFGMASSHDEEFARLWNLLPERSIQTYGW